MVDMLEPKRKRIKTDTIDIKEAENLYSSYTGCGIFLIDLFDYLHLNATGVRKILKKHDKAIKLMGVNKENSWLTTSFLSDRMQAPDSALRLLVTSEKVSYAEARIEFAVTVLREILIVRAHTGTVSQTQRKFNTIPAIINDIRYVFNAALVDSSTESMYLYSNCVCLHLPHIP